MAKTGDKKPRPVLARERIYPGGVYRHALAMLEEMLALARDHPDRLRYPQRHIDPTAGCFSPYGFVEHLLSTRFREVVPQRDHMFQWVQMVVFRVIGDAGEALTDFRPVIIPFLMDQSSGRGIGYLTRSKTTPEELVGVLEEALLRLRAVGPDGLFSLFMNPPLPEYWEPQKWPRGFKLVDVEPDR